MEKQHPRGSYSYVAFVENINITELYEQLTRSIDRIDMSIYASHDIASVDRASHDRVQHTPTDRVRSMLSMLQDAGYDRVSDRHCRSKLFSRVCTLKSSHSSLVVMYDRKSPLYPACMVAVHDPDSDALELLGSIFSHHGFTPRVRMAEVALDFSTRHPSLLRQHIAAHLFCPCQRKASGSYQDLTHYTTDVRRSAKGHRLYGKVINGRFVVRLELVLNRPVLRRLALTGLRDAHETLLALDLGPFLQFRTLDLNALARHLYRRHRKPSINQAQHEGLFHDHLRSFLTAQGLELMPQVEQLRRLGKSLGRFVVRDRQAEQIFHHRAA